MDQPQDVAAKVESFTAMCEVADVILSAKYGRLDMASAAQQLRRTMSRALDLHVKAHGPDNVKPKMHWVFDIADQFEK
jgi:hypothetical protein